MAEWLGLLCHFSCFDARPVRGCLIKVALFSARSLSMKAFHVESLLASAARILAFS
jgi:hypothetical protein